MNRTVVGLYPLLAFALIAADWQSAGGQNRDTVDPDARAAVVRELAEVLRREYILDDIGARMAAALESRLSSGAYAGPADPATFARELTDDLRAVYVDRHLAVLPPDRFRAFADMVAGDHGPGDRGLPPDIIARVMNRDGRTDVGYLKLPRFDGTAGGLERIEAAMEALRGAEALIIDLRGSPGGDADAVRALSSHLFATRTHLVTSIGRRTAAGTRPRFERWTEPTTLSEAFASVPVYLLIDGDTFSAAESFAFGLKQTGRAVLIGEPTGGGGHMNAPFALPGGFGASISVGRTYDPRTGEGWQSTGVTPTVEIETDHALATAFSIIAERAAEAAGLDERTAGVHDALQAFADAWYVGDSSRMRELLDDGFTATRIRGPDTAAVWEMADLLSATGRGDGVRTPRELRNRVITILDVHGALASAKLVLRETVQLMQLRYHGDGWVITSALITPKPRHHAG